MYFYINIMFLLGHPYARKQQLWKQMAYLTFLVCLKKLHLKYLHCCFKLWWRHQNPFTWMNPPSNYKVLTAVDFTVRYLATDGICCPPHAGQLKLILWRCIRALVGNAGGRQSGTSGGPPSSRVHFQTDGCQPEECGGGEEVPGEPVKIPPPT